MISTYTIKLHIQYLKHTLAIISVILMLSACSLIAPEILSKSKGPEVKEITEPRKDEDRILEAYKDFAFSSLAISQGNYEKARELLSHAIEKDPESLYLHTKMAMLLKGLKKFPEALSYALKCVELDPEDMRYRIMLADLYTLTGNDTLAAEQYNKALNLEPENKRIRLLVTTILIREGKFQKALDHLDKLIEQSPELVIAHYYRGKVKMEMKQYREAEQSFLEVLRLKEDQDSAMFDLGTLYQITGRYKDAAEVFERLLGFYANNISVRVRLINIYTKLDLKEQVEKHIYEIKRYSQPGDPERQALGLIYLRQGKLDESITELATIISKQPGDNKTRYYLAVAYQEKGESEKALEHFRLINQDSKYFSDAQMHIAFILDTQEKYDEAKIVLEKALALSEKEPELYLMLASLYENREKYDKAINVIKEGLIQNDNNIDLIFRLGIILDKSGDKSSCLEQMKKILEIDPNHADSLNYVGYTYAEQGIRLDEAMEMIKKALELKPDSGYIIDSLGWVYFQKGLYDKAIFYLEKSAKITPNDPTINEHLGDAYLKKQQYEKAIEYFNKALSLEHPSEKALKEKIAEVEKLLEQGVSSQ